MGWCTIKKGDCFKFFLIWAFIKISLGNFEEMYKIVIRSKTKTQNLVYLVLYCKA